MNTATPVQRLLLSRQRMEQELARGHFADTQLAGALVWGAVRRNPLAGAVVLVGLAGLVMVAVSASAALFHLRPGRAAPLRPLRPAWKALVRELAWYAAERALLSALQPRRPQAQVQAHIQAPISKKA